MLLIVINQFVYSVCHRKCMFTAVEAKWRKTVFCYFSGKL